MVQYKKATKAKATQDLQNMALDEGWNKAKSLIESIYY